MTATRTTWISAPTAASCRAAETASSKGEVCDDGNRSDNDLCTNACQVARCGDGILHTGVEQCDDGNQNNNDGCSNTCTSGAAPRAVISSPTEPL